MRVDLNNEIGKIRDWPKQAKIDDFGAAVRLNLTTRKLTWSDDRSIKLASGTSKDNGVDGGSDDPAGSSFTTVRAESA